MWFQKKKKPSKKKNLKKHTLYGISELEIKTKKSQKTLNKIVILVKDYIKEKSSLKGNLTNEELFSNIAGTVVVLIIVMVMNRVIRRRRYARRHGGGSKK